MNKLQSTIAILDDYVDEALRFWIELISGSFD